MQPAAASRVPAGQRVAGADSAASRRERRARGGHVSPASAPADAPRAVALPLPRDGHLRVRRAAPPAVDVRHRGGQRRRRRAAAGAEPLRVSVPPPAAAPRLPARRLREHALSGRRAAARRRLAGRRRRHAAAARRAVGPRVRRVPPAARRADRRHEQAAGDGVTPAVRARAASARAVRHHAAAARLGARGGEQPARRRRQHRAAPADEARQPVGRHVRGRRPRRGAGRFRRSRYQHDGAAAEPQLRSKCAQHEQRDGDALAAAAVRRRSERRPLDGGDPGRVSAERGRAARGAGDAVSPRQHAGHADRRRPHGARPAASEHAQHAAEPDGAVRRAPPALRRAAVRQRLQAERAGQHAHGGRHAAGALRPRVSRAARRRRPDVHGRLAPRRARAAAAPRTQPESPERDAPAQRARRQRQPARGAGAAGRARTVRRAPRARPRVAAHLPAVGREPRPGAVPVGVDHLPLAELHLSEVEGHAAGEHVHVRDPGLRADLRGRPLRAPPAAVLQLDGARRHLPVFGDGALHGALRPAPQSHVGVRGARQRARRPAALAQADGARRHLQGPRAAAEAARAAPAAATCSAELPPGRRVGGRCADETRAAAHWFGAGVSGIVLITTYVPSYRLCVNPQITPGRAML